MKVLVALLSVAVVGIGVYSFTLNGSLQHERGESAEANKRLVTLQMQHDQDVAAVQKQLDDLKKSAAAREADLNTQLASAKAEIAKFSAQVKQSRALPARTPAARTVTN